MIAQVFLSAATHKAMGSCPTDLAHQGLQLLSGASAGTRAKAVDNAAQKSVVSTILTLCTGLVQSGVRCVQEKNADACPVADKSKCTRIAKLAEFEGITGTEVSVIADTLASADPSTMVRQSALSDMSKTKLLHLSLVLLHSLLHDLLEVGDRRAVERECAVGCGAGAVGEATEER